MSNTFRYQNTILGGPISRPIGGQDGGQANSLTSRQKEVFVLIIDNPKISRRELATKLEINESAVQKHIQALKKKKVIERDGETTGQWIIVNNK